MRHPSVENHDVAGQGIPAALSAARSAARFSQGALLWSLESGQPGNTEAVATALGTEAGAKKAGRRTGAQNGMGAEMPLLQWGNGGDRTATASGEKPASSRTEISVNERSAHVGTGCIATRLPMVRKSKAVTRELADKGTEASDQR